MKLDRGVCDSEVNIDIEQILESIGRTFGDKVRKYDDHMK